jgi:hypothetical protein
MIQRLVLTILLLALSGCGDALYWYGRTVYGVDCAPAVVQANHGSCRYVTQGDTHAETPPQ